MKCFPSFKILLSVVFLIIFVQIVAAESSTTNISLPMLDTPLNEGIPDVNVSQIHPTVTIHTIKGGTGVGNSSGEVIKTVAPSGVHVDNPITNTAAVSVITGASLSPDPYFPTGPDHGTHIDISYTPTGLIYSYLVGKDVTNRGGAGNVFYTISGDYFSLKSKVFWMESGETVTVWAEICNGIVTFIPFQQFSMNVRASQAGDTEVGSFVIKPPKNWGFSGTPTSGTAPLTVKFTDTSAGSWTSWSWDFGDGGTSTLQNPSHTYTTAGTYNVHMNAIIPRNSSTSYTRNKYITVTSEGVTPIGVGIFCPSTGYWYLDNNLDGSFDKSFRFGSSTDQIIKGNWTGTGSEGIAIFRPSTGYWYFDNNLDGILDNSFRYGSSTDRIIQGNWVGTTDGIAIFRPSTGYWYFDNNLDGVVDKRFRYGSSTDQIIKGDWQGSGKDGIAIFRPSTGYWYFDYNLDGIVDKSFRYGSSGDRIISGNWQGTQDGIAIFRPSTGYWYFDYNRDGIIDKSFRYGSNGDQIIAGDWNGDGNDGIAIFRPSTGYWYFDYNLDGVVDKSFRYGSSTDRIIVGKWA
jgi:uncharacterized protein YneR